MKRLLFITTLVITSIGLPFLMTNATSGPADTDARPVFCKLTSAEMRQRLGELRTQFLTEIVAVDELESGFRYWVDKSPEHLVMLAKFVDFESACCGFLDFEMGLTGGADKVSLTLTGADGTKAFLEDMMNAVSFDWRAGG